MGDGRSVLISGASRGLGREIAVQLAARGRHVVVGAREIEAGGRATPVALDVTDPGSVADAVARVRAEGGGLGGEFRNDGGPVAW